ncbi:hypothetical protein KC669_01170 [Candidatus Dojkabacteria bacterium]|uniref:DUF5082 domain-containing protein n=1 Tax=Candidatus Dojkabacteria bacterium TaxID=2099670 RepID=A0A955RLS6_9BACT|nr:hypothetical protein [Candidatus Dojkabacteria bacterium]
MKKHFLILSSSILVFSFFLAPVSAQVTKSLESRDNNQLTEQSKQTRCERVTTRLQTVNSRYEQAKEKYSVRYRAIYNRINTLIDQLTEDEFDTTALQQDVDELNLLIGDFQDTVNNITESTNSLKQSACDGDRDAFNVSKTNLESLVKDLKNTSQEIRELVTIQIKSDLESLKN